MSGNSPAPGTPQTGTKAQVATAISFVGTFAAFWIADTGAFEPKEIVGGLLLAATASGLTGGVSYFTKNKAK